MSEKLYYFVTSYWDKSKNKTVIHKPIIVTIENWYGSQAIIRKSNGQLLIADYYQLWSQSDHLTFDQLDQEIKKYFGDEAEYL